MLPTTHSRRALLALASLSSLSAAQCARRPPSRTAPQRIISVAPNTTEMLFALGLGARVVGVSSICDFPEQARSLPRVGALGSLSLEAILALRPDAVVGAPGVPASIVERLQSRGVTVLVRAVESVASVRALALALAALCAAPELHARWLARFDSELAAAQRVFAPTHPPRVLAVIDQRPIYCAGPGSYVDELLRLANARNAITTGPAWPQLSIETVLQSAPDVILDLCGPLAQEPIARAWSAHRAIAAVRDGRVIAVPDALVTRPGPRAPRAVELVARALASVATA